MRDTIYLDGMKKILSTILLVCIILSASATSYERLSSRMNDYFNHAEWSDVLQETNIMIQMKPLDADPYAAALIAAQFLKQEDTIDNYLYLSQGNRIHIDTLLQHVYERTRAIHNAQIYEELLLNLKAHHKGLARVFNIYLIEFYAFARKTQETIIIADELLSVTPDNLRFQELKADALFYQGNSQEAVSLYENIIQSDSTNYEIITLLAAYYASQADTTIKDLDKRYNNTPTPQDSLYIVDKQRIIDTHVAQSLNMLYKANEIRQSNFVEKEIARLKNISCNPPLHPSLKRKSILNKLKKN